MTNYLTSAPLFYVEVLEAYKKLPNHFKNILANMSIWKLGFFLEKGVYIFGNVKLEIVDFPRCTIIIKISKIPRY